MRDFNEVGKVLKKERERKGISQCHLSKLVGYKNGQFVSNIERGLCSIPLKNIRKIAKELEVDPSKFTHAMTKDYKTTLDNYLAKGGK